MWKSALVSAFFVAANPVAHAVIVDFDDLVVGEVFAVGETILSNGVSMEVIDFAAFAGIEGIVRVSDFMGVGGSGLELGFSRTIGVDFDVPIETTFVSLLYANSSNTAGITVNGEMSSIGPGLDRLDGSTLGGASISTTAIVGAGEQGMLVLQGPISTFAIGGTEFGIDDVTFAVPEPTTATFLLFFGVTLITLWRNHSS